MKKEAFFPHQSNFKELIQLIIDHFEKTNRRIDLEKIVEMAQRIWNH